MEQKSHSFANLAPRTRHIRHRLSCASVPPDFIDQKEKGISDQSNGEIDENGVFHCFPHELPLPVGDPLLALTIIHSTHMINIPRATPDSVKIMAIAVINAPMGTRQVLFAVDMDFMALEGQGGRP